MAFTDKDREKLTEVSTLLKSIVPQVKSNTTFIDRTKGALKVLLVIALPIIGMLFA